MAQGSSIKTTTMINLASSSMNGSYQLVGFFSHPIQLLRIINATDQSITISYDGIHDADFLQMTDTLQVQLFAYASNFFNAAFAKGTGVYIKGSAGSGNVYVTGYFNPVIL